jgi:hypothetical protein
VYGARSYGVVATNSTLNKLDAWLKNGKSIRIGCRLNAPLFKLTGLLLVKGYNIHLNGFDKPAVLIEKLMHQLKPTSVTNLQAILAEKFKAMKSVDQMEQCRIECLSSAVEAWILMPDTEPGLPESVTAFGKHIHSKYPTTGNSIIHAATWQAQKGKQSDIVLHFQPELCPIEKRLNSNLPWEPNEERCIEFISKSRAIEELHYLVHIDNLTTSMMDSVLFPKVHELQADEDEDFISSLMHSNDMTVEQALSHLGLAELPASPRHLYMATYGRFKEAKTSTDENFPTNMELRDAREIIKAALEGLAK